MIRRKFVTLLGRATAAWPFVARAQQGERVRRIAVLLPIHESDAEGQLRKSAFVQGVQKFGWTDGSNVMIHYRWGGGNADRIPLHAAERTGMGTVICAAAAGVKAGNPQNSDCVYALRSGRQRRVHLRRVFHGPEDAAGACQGSGARYARHTLARADEVIE